MPPLGDVVARARGLARHLLAEEALSSLATARGSGALADELAHLGYPRVSDDRAGPISAIEAVEASIEYETARRLSLLVRWLGPRRQLFVGVFEQDELRVLRIFLRRVSAGRASAGARPPVEALTSFGRGAREELLRAVDPAAFARVLKRLGSPYGAPLIASLRAGESGLLALESALDRTFAARARAAAQRVGGCLLAWVVQGIDLGNAWGALLGAPDPFVEGGERLTRAEFDRIAREESPSARRAALAGVFAADGLGAVFEDAAAPLAALESRSRIARLRELRRAARIDPLGPAALLEAVMRLREEPKRLRRIAWAVAQGIPESAGADAWAGALS
jgi:hypothetical protein